MESETGRVGKISDPGRRKIRGRKFFRGRRKIRCRQVGKISDQDRKKIRGRSEKNPFRVGKISDKSGNQ
ncbi:hypothetical protein F116p31 [Pseudomonas phage F116]|uniref:Uncharacterized protein n=1 Tax=Pseudomonas phage F116 TaxID=2679904 RepID=Q5QF78_9CAUD|nr:hypothetical protein F116p31 [Pseudomonas phage F116]AAT47227.1 unknown [Pseudomonas phage F116]